jgi:hypothetical protein
MRSQLVFAAGQCLLLTGCGEQVTPVSAPQPELVELFSCSHLLIGLETAYCHEDVVGPGTLAVSFRPDPKETSWEIGVRGLAALAEQCEFHGRFDQTRLSGLQGRGETDIVCNIAANVDRQYHEIRFENRLDAPNTAINVRVSFTR